MRLWWLAGITGHQFLMCRIPPLRLNVNEGSYSAVSTASTAQGGRSQGLLDVTRGAQMRFQEVSSEGGMVFAWLRAEHGFRSGM